jgi:cell division protein FtsB
MRRHSKIGYWLSLLLMIGLMWVYVHYRDLPGQYAKYEDSERAVQELRHQLEIAKQDESRLQKSVADLDKDPVEWEAAIRHQKGLVHEGEKIYRVESAPE